VQKIPTLFMRDFTKDHGRYVIVGDVTPGCEWVLAGEGRATRKYDGTCVRFTTEPPDQGRAWSRRVVKPGKAAPDGFVILETDETDETTGNQVGWEPSDQSGFLEYIDEGIMNWLIAHEGRPPDGTYELIGPKINGNPEHSDRHVLVPHGQYDLEQPFSWTADDLAEWVREMPWEGVVWHHEDGRMAKLKAKDLPEVPA
jgi:hypothetical protein